MPKSSEQDIRARLDALPQNERLKLLKRASQIRQSKQRSRSEHSKRVSLESIVFEILAEDDRDVAKEPSVGHGVVIWRGTSTCRVRTDSAEQDCLLPKKGRSDEVVVGDEVSFAPYGTDFMVSKIATRRTVLSRPDPDGKRDLVIAANIDVVVIVAAFVAPPLKPRMIDRYLVAIQRGGARPVLCLNKSDLLNAENRSEEEGKLLPYQSLMPIIRCSASDSRGIDDLRTLLDGQTCALVGKSGVGKSSIVNVLAQTSLAETQTVSGMTAKGRHTTTASTLYDLGKGVRLIDTPGVRSFGLSDVDGEGLRWYFPEFEDFRDDCKFRDCTHHHEPSCGIRSAVEHGTLNRNRYETYLRILETL